ncbi:hypothetical protein [Streptomyces sp. NPDC088812]|uniref:hypothetical protein n=1 Tax=Streptomyces sp. NPDC088812 TaxID=3365905 RepID=UPI0037F4AC70
MTAGTVDTFPDPAVIREDGSWYAYGTRNPAGKVGVAARGAGAAADDVGAVKLYTPVTQRGADPRPGALLPACGDEFDSGERTRRLPAPDGTGSRGVAAGTAQWPEPCRPPSWSRWRGSPR